MARTNLTEGRKQEFIKCLQSFGGRSGNKALSSALGWDDEFYSRVQAQLISEGKIRSGRGRGGSVSIVEESTANLAISDQQLPPPPTIPDQDLYAPIRKQLETKWIATRGYDTFIIEETHSQGSKQTACEWAMEWIVCLG